MITLPDADQINAAIRAAEAATDEQRTFVLPIDRLFDPETNPQQWQRARAVMHRLRTAHDLDYRDRDRPEGAKPFDPHDPGMQAVLVHFVGDPDVVHVMRDDSRIGRPFWLQRLRWERGGCDFGDAVDCTADTGLLAYVSVTRPPWILVFTTCLVCFLHLHDTTEGGGILAEADARVAFDAAAAAARTRWSEAGR